VLENLSFRVEGGERIGVVGRTGAGKSTLCLSFSRMVDIIEGSIMIDGVDIKSVELEHLRRMITVIPQDPTIFSGTLRFNLDPEGKADDHRILHLLRAAQLDDFLAKDPRGLYMPVQAAGANLSSGER